MQAQGHSLTTNADGRQVHREQMSHPAHTQSATAGTAPDTGEGSGSAWGSDEEEDPDDPLDEWLAAPMLRGVDAATFFESLSPFGCGPLID